MTKQNIGYLLPPGDAFTDELACAIVFYPDKKAYRQALTGSILYLCDWLAWERDEEKRGKDAALAWKLATELTLECMDMGCFEQLQLDVHDILLHLQATVPCCGETITYGDSTVYVTTINPGVGDPPDYYGETEVTDWDDWREHVCYNAHLWVDELKSQADTLETVLDVGGLTVGLVAFALSAIAMFVIGGFTAFPVVLSVVAGLAAGYTQNMFTDAKDDIESARDSIVCALTNGLNVAGAVETALNSGPAWDLFYSHVDYETAIAIIHEGGANGEYLSAETRSDCDCEQLGQYMEYWNMSDEEEPDPPFFISETAYLATSRGYLNSYCMAVDFFDSAFWTNVSRMRNFIGIGSDEESTITLKRLKFWYGFRLAGPETAEMRVEIQHDGGTLVLRYDHVLYDVGAFIEEVFEPPLVMTFGLERLVYFSVLNGTGAATFVDEITLDFDASADV
jgi:hypothetical protein